MKRLRAFPIVCRLAALAAAFSCGPDEPAPEAPVPPTEEEIQAVWEGMCDLYLSDVRVMRCLVEEIPDLEAAREACLMGQYDLYYCMPGCVEPNYAAETCLVEAHADLDYDDPLNEHYLCEMSAPECEDVLGERYNVTCGGCDWSGVFATSGGNEEGGGT